MDNLWILTEERPKASVILQIVEMYCKDFSDKITLNHNIKIKPIIEKGVFQFVYIVEGLRVAKAKEIYICTCHRHHREQIGFRYISFIAHLLKWKGNGAPTVTA